MEVKQLTKTHISQILQLEENNTAKPYYAKYGEDALNFIFNNPKICNAIGLFDKDKLVGWGSYGPDEHKQNKESGVKIYAIVIDKKYRRKGLGKLILKRILSELKEKGKRDIFLTVSPFNTGALLLYLNNGFIIYNYKKDLYGPGLDRLYLHLMTK